MRHQANTSTLPMCVACLSICGWGIKRICRHTGFAKTTVHRFVRLHELSDKALGDSRRDNHCHNKHSRAMASVANGTHPNKSKILRTAMAIDRRTYLQEREADADLV
jgi:hypothetical protein